jgi:hypothetical protein
MLKYFTGVGLNCTFENGFCGWQQFAAPRDQFDWGRQNGTTSSYDTGPKYDHTLGPGWY